jgi:hypothetical protein
MPNGEEVTTLRKKESGEKHLQIILYVDDQA